MDQRLSNLTRAPSDTLSVLNTGYHMLGSMGHGNRNKCKNTYSEMDVFNRDVNSYFESDRFLEPESMQAIIDDSSGLYDSAVSESRRFLFRIGLVSRRKRDACNLFMKSYNGLMERCHDHNHALASHMAEKVSDIVCPVDGKMLDEHQLASIAMDVRNRVVIAGAGTGKTATIVGLGKYLVKTGAATPEEILFLSFTNSAVSELSERLRKAIGSRCDVSTFHRLGMRLIAESEERVPRITGIDQNRFIMDELTRMMGDKGSYRKIVEYLAFYGMHAGSESDFKDRDTYLRFIRDNPLITMRGETVKSYGEADIANFLYINGIDYTYEDTYPVDTRDAQHGQYRPDFHLDGTDVYIEYYGVDRQGEVAPFMRDGDGGSDTYRAGMKWKRNLHSTNGTRLIELFSYQRQEGNLLDALREGLEDRGIWMEPMPTNVAYQKISGGSDRVLRALASQLSTALMLVKGKGRPLESSLEKIPLDDEARRFVSILEPILNRYQSELSSKGEIDFEDMINLAADHLKNGDCTHHYRYIIVDEYQDISSSRMNLLTSMRSAHDYRLFCVGDDWQGIYRFNGSDVSYISEFEKHWGPSETCKLERTYRYGGELLELSNRFMSGRLGQVDKTLVGMGKMVPVSFIHGRNTRECTRAVAKRLDALPPNGSVLFLGRYRHDVSMLDGDIMSWRPDLSDGYYSVTYAPRNDLKMRFMTIHGSKGLEADHVIILNNLRGGSGFPSLRPESSLIRGLLNGHGGPMDEERRMMYVAMTRARVSLDLVVEVDRESVFVEEIVGISEGRGRRCPLCGGILVERSGRYGRFYGCSNYRNGCRFTSKIDD